MSQDQRRNKLPTLEQVSQIELAPLHSRSPAENREHVKAWRMRQGQAYLEKNRIRVRNYTRLKLYGMSVEAFDAMFDAQGRVCAICKAEPASSRDTHVDHDHETGNIRGILCGSCNKGIGNMADNPGRLRAAADYIEQHYDK